VERAVEETPVEMKVIRFDQAFFGSTPEKLPELKKKYPFFFPQSDDKVWTDKMQDPVWKDVYKEVEKKFPDFNGETDSIENLFKHIKYYFPKTKIPVVYTIIGQMDYNTKVLYAKDTLIISLELYLGKDHKFYVDDFDKYIRQQFDVQQLLPDIASAFAENKIPPPDNTFLGQMIYAGKELYLKDIFLPDYKDAQKIGYKPEQITWCEENENYIWRYFLNDDLIYSTDPHLNERFIKQAPFSKFYLDIDNESPGRIGAWIGWQIVRSYMENNQVSAEQLLKTDAKEIFVKSRYKPKKA
jgi:gliding motility-associated lipoprotein GldB